MLKKYTGVILVAAICVLLAIAALIADKNTEAPSDEAVSETNASIEGKNIAIDYGKSDTYSKQDMNAAIELIEKEFATWEGCVLHSISYTSDECNSKENIDWMNGLREGGNYTVTDENAEFTQCIEFVSDFHSPKTGGDVWEADHEYTNWQWWLARTDNGEWNLITWGY